MFALVDDESVDKDETDKLSVAVRDMDDFHPRKMTFSDYLVEKLLSSPDTKSLYEARIAELQRIQDYTDERHGHEHRKAKTDSHFVIHSDTAFDTSSMLGRAIETGDLASLRDNDTPSRLILSVLSATPDLVHESVPGSLLHHQRKIVESLTKLEKTDPEKFDILWKTLEGDFANLHRSTAWRDPLRDYKLLGEYYLRTGRFVSKELSKERLVELSARQLTESVIKEEAIHYSQFDDYKNQAKLLELLVKKHGVKTGLTVADMEEIVNGGTAMENELSSLQPAQQQELASFERRLQLLKVIRQQEKMPSLKELQEAYLN